VNPSAPPAPSTAMTLEREPEAVDQLIARVLGRAHRTMEAIDAPSEARAILHVAHSFADELATLDPRFDRLQFIKDVTEDPS
jgi:acyl transferase domain-containing protein